MPPSARQLRQEAGPGRLDRARQRSESDENAVATAPGPPLKCPLVASLAFALLVAQSVYRVAVLTGMAEMETT